MIRGIYHFGLTVRDVDVSTAWCEGLLVFRDPDNIQLGFFAKPPP
jgi:hypothetical protein